MNCRIKLTVCLLGCFALTLGAGAIVNEGADGNPYHAIVERNVFDLKPPTPPAAVATVTNTPPPNVKLTGITTILGNKRALFMVQEAPVQGKPQKEESYILTEGQRQGVLEVLEINEKGGTVKIKNDGTVSVVTFETIKLPNAAAGAPANPLGVPPPHLPNFTPPPLVGNNPNLNGGATPTPGRYGAAPGNGGVGGNDYSPQNGLSALPTRTLRTTDQPGPSTAEEAALMAMANSEISKSAIQNNKKPPFPIPSGFLNQGQNQNSAPFPGQQTP